MQSSTIGGGLGYGKDSQKTKPQGNLRKIKTQVSKNSLKIPRRERERAQKAKITFGYTKKKTKSLSSRKEEENSKNTDSLDHN